MISTIAVQNTGAGQPDRDTIVIFASLPGQLAFSPYGACARHNVRRGQL